MSDLQPPAQHASSENQLSSYAELTKQEKYSRYEHINLDDRTNYFRVSCRPITKKAEDDMEMISDIITWGEEHRYEKRNGAYLCSQCNRHLFDSCDKWDGPCVWPSFRKPFQEDSISTTEVFPYNNYTVVVKEVYCGGCDLFIGHQFEDGVDKGDRYHCFNVKLLECVIHSPSQ